MVPMFSVADASQCLPKASITAHVSTTLFRLLPVAIRSDRAPAFLEEAKTIAVEP